MTHGIDTKNYYPANEKVLETPVEEVDGLATSTHRRREKGLRTEVIIRAANHEFFLPAAVAQRDGEDVDVIEILPDDFQGDKLRIEVPPYAFIPDEWSRAFLRGLAKVHVKGKFCLEVGVGTGINVIYLLPKSPEAIVFCDKDSRCTPLACRNIKRNLPDNHSAHAVPYAGSLDLLAWVQGTGIVRSRNFDVIYGCLPQVILPEGKQIEEGDALAHYYEGDRYTSDFDIYGLALNDMCLQQAHLCLDKDGAVVLNLGGRPGQGILEELFRKNGFEPQLLHKEVIQQHEGTSIESLVTLESVTPRNFEFFEDEAANKKISATQANERRRSGRPIFHCIYVYQGRKIS